MFVLICKDVDTTQLETFESGCVRDVKIWSIKISTIFFSIFVLKLLEFQSANSVPLLHGCRGGSCCIHGGHGAT